MEQWHSVKMWTSTYWKLKLLAAKMQSGMAEALDISIDHQLEHHKIKEEVEDGAQDQQDNDRG